MDWKWKINKIKFNGKPRCCNHPYLVTSKVHYYLFGVYLLHNIVIYEFNFKLTFYNHLEKWKIHEFSWCLLHISSNCMLQTHYNGKQKVIHPNLHPPKSYIWIDTLTLTLLETQLWKSFTCIHTLCLKKVLQG